ncbi:MAG: efflux RND transporter periplasmic adaptor subunit [Candidatus Magasanikbacteria bacterium]|nr:efflux RND transporter periplasmic adaptor subunit [Candidatus Magasanikbacteria bacterium]
MEQTNTKNKKWYKRKLFYALVVGGLVIGSIVYGQIQKANAPIQYETVKVERGTLVQTVDATGKVESADELELRFEAGGRIGKVYKKANDRVKKGQILVDLDLSQLNAQVAQASASVAKAQANLNKVLAGETSEYISNFKAKLDQASANLDQAMASSADTIANAKAALETAQNNLKLSEGGENSQIVEDAYEDMIALLQSVQSTLADALTEADNILGIDNTLANDDFDDVLSALNSSALNTAHTKYYIAKEAKLNADLKINAVGISTARAEIDAVIVVGQNALFSLKELLFAVSQVLDATVPIGDLTQSELTTLKSNIQTDRNAVSTKYSALIDQTQAIATAKNSYSIYQVAYTQAQTNLTNAKAKANADIAVYEALLAQAQASYDDVKSPPRVEDVATAQAQVREAQASLSAAAAARNKSRIISPVNGVIGKIDAKVGEYVGPADIVVKIISPHFEVKVDIPETDIIKISQGNDAQITLDAYGDDVEFIGKVSEIEIGETVIQDVVYYSVTVSLEDEKDGHTILNGMSADVTFATEQKENVLFIPQRTLRTDDAGKKFVQVLENNEPKDVYIETGLRGDGGFVEVISGLEEGDEVVIRVIE